MTDHAPEGTHVHSHQPMPLDPGNVVRTDQMLPTAPHLPPQDEAVTAGAQQWFAREFVQGLMSLAEAANLNPLDFLADKMMILSQRLANAESEVQVLRTQNMALRNDNMLMHVKLDDCNCHDDATVQADPVNQGGVTPNIERFLDGTINGDNQ